MNPHCKVETKSKSGRGIRLHAAFTLACVLCCLPAGGLLHAQGVSGTFIGSGSTWSNASNWSSGSVPGSNAPFYDEALFADEIGGLETSRTLLLDGLFNLNQLNVTAGLKQALTLTDGGVAGRGFNIGGAGAQIALLNDASLTVNANVFFDTPATIHSQLGVLTFNTGKTFSIGGNDLTVDAATDGASIRLLSNITGDAASLTKIGTGELRLTGSNTFTGGVNFNAGRLLIDNDRALGTGTFFIGDGVNPTTGVTIALTASHKIDNQLVWNNDLAVVNAGVATIKTLSLDATGTVTLTGERKLELSDYVSVRMGEGLALTGVGGLYVYGNVTGGMEFRNAHSTFEGGYRQGLKSASVGTGSNSITLGALDDGHNYIGSGSVTVSGTYFTLTLNPGAQYSTNLRGTVALDWGAILDIVSGTTVLDGATLIDLDPDRENRFVFRGDTIFTSATFVNSPVLYFTAAAGRTLTIGGAGMGSGADKMILDGSGTIALTADAANIGAGQIRLESGALILGADDQIQASSTLYLGDGTLLRTGGYSADFTGGVSWGNSGSRVIDLGNGGGSGSVLNFGAGSLGGSGTVYVQNWKDGADALLFSNDITLATWRNNVRFDGYNWGLGVQVVNNAGNYELVPAVGTTAAPGIYEWTGSASFSTGASGTNMWSAPGNWDLNRIPEFGAGTTMVFGNKYSYAPTVTFPSGTLTVGNILFSRSNNLAVTISSGTLIMDSGTAGVAAQMKKSYYDSGSISSAIYLNSNLLLGQSDAIAVVSASGTRVLSGKISDGAAGSAITVTGGKWYLSNTTNDFAGGIILDGGALILGYSGSNSALGNGVLTIKSGALWGGYIYNKVIFDGDFILSNVSGVGTQFYATGNAANDTIMLDKNITITGVWNSGSLSLGNYSYLYFREGRNLQGLGGLTLAGSWDGLYTYAYDSNFSGGYTQRGGTMQVYANSASANGSVVFGTLAPGKNYLGVGNVTLAGGNITVNPRSGSTVEFLNGIVVTASNGTFTANTAPVYFKDSSTLNMYNNGYFTVSAMPVYFQDGSTLRFYNGGNFTGNNDVYFSNMNLIGASSTASGFVTVGRNLIIGDVTVSQTPNINMSGNYSVKAESGTVALTGLGRFTRSTQLTTTTIESSISQLGASQFYINAGRLKLTRDNQIAGTADLSLYSTAIVNSDGVKNKFGALYIQGASTMELGTHGELAFSRVASWGNSAGILYLLNIQNNSGAWNTTSDLSLGGEHIWLTSTAGITSPMLESVAFTGYTRGAGIVSNSGTFELVASGEKGFEWAGVGGNNFWGTGANWFGGVAPAAAGDIAIFRDADSAIGSKTIMLNGDRTVGKIFFEATTGATINIGGAAGQALIFDNNDSQSVIYFGGASSPVISANIALTNTHGLLIDHQSSVNTLTLSGTISGTGGILFTVDPATLNNTNNQNYYLVLSGNNTFSGGVEQQGGRLYINNNNALGTGTYTITGTAMVTINASRTVTNPLKLDGGLYAYGNSTSYSLTFKNNTGVITSGTKNIYIGSSFGSLIFDSDYVLTGDGALRVQSYSYPSTAYQLILRGQNTFTGGVTLNGGAIWIGASSQTEDYQLVFGPLGTGTYTFSNGATFMETALQHYVIHNPLSLGTSGNVYLGYYSSSALVAGSLTFDSIENLKLRSGANTFYLMGAMVEFKNSITNPDTGTGSFTLQQYTSSPAFLRLSGSNSFTGNFTVNSNYGTSTSYLTTLSLGNDAAIGTGTLILSGSMIGLQAYGADRNIRNLAYFNNGTSTTYFTATGGAQSLLFSGTGNSTITSGTKYWNVANGMIVTFGTAHNLVGTGASLVKQGGGELQLLAPKSTFNGLTVNSGTVSTTLLDGRDMVLGATGTGAQDNYFGIGALTISGIGAVARINTWVDGDDAGEVIVRGGLSVSNGGLLDIRGGGNLVFAYTGTVTTGATSGTISIGDGGWLVKDGANTTTVLDASIVAPILIRGGTLSLVRANLLSNASSLTMAGSSALMLNSLHQTLNGDWSLTGMATLDFGNKNLPGESTLFTVGDLGTWDLNSTLLVTNWYGNLASGGGNSQILISNYSGTGQFVPNVWFAGYGPGAYVQDRGGGNVELVPYATTYKWVGGSNSVWSLQENWHEFAMPNVPGVSVSFGDAASTTKPSGTSITLDSNKSVGSLVFEGTRNQHFNFSGIGSIIFDIAEEEKLKGVVGQIVMAQNNHATINGPVQLNVDLLINNLAGSTLEIAGEIYQSGGYYKLVKRGEGSLTLSNGNSSFDGGAFLEGGLLRINADETLNAQGYVARSPIGAGALTISGGAIEAYNANRTISNRIIFEDDFTVAGSNTLTFAYDSSVIPGAEKSIISGTSVAINVADAAGTLVITATNTLIGDGRLVKDGAGTLELRGANEYTGGTEIRQGTLAISDSLSMNTQDVAFSGNSALRLDADILTLANAIDIHSGVTATINTQAHTGTLSGPITGDGGLAKAGSGTLTLTSSNSYAGNTTITAGALVATDADALSTGTVNVAAGAKAELVFSSATVANVFTGSGETVVAGDDLRLTADNTAFTGTWSVDGSALVSAPANLGANSTVIIGGTLTVDGENDFAFASKLDGAGVLNFDATGTNSFTANAGAGAANFTGLINANAGALRWDANATGVLAPSATLALNDGLLDIAAGAQEARGFIIAGGTMAFTGTAVVNDFAITGSSNIIFTQAAMQASELLQQDEGSGRTYVIAQNQDWEDDISNLHLVLADGTLIGASSTLAIPSGSGSDAAAYGVYSNTLTAAGGTLGIAYRLEELKLQAGKILVLQSDTTPPDGGDDMKALISGEGSLEIQATNAITLVRQETYTGTTFTTSGTLIAGVADVIASSTAFVNNAVFDMNGYNQQVGSLSGSGTILIGGNTLTVNEAISTTYSGILDGANGSLQKSGTGTLALTGSNTYTGATTITAGELQIGAGGTTGSILALTDTTKNISIAAGASLAFARSDSITYSGTNITGAGSLIQRGGGLLLLERNQNYTGGTVIESGTLKIANGGAVGTSATRGITDLVDIHSGAVFYIGEQGGGYNLMNTLKGDGTLIVDINETTHTSNSADLFGFAQGAVEYAADNGAQFHGTVEMRNAQYVINPFAEAFFNAGISSLRTTAGSYGSLLANSGSARYINGTVDFAGGVFQWDFDDANDPLAYLDAGAIKISAETEFRLNLKNALQVNTAEIQDQFSLFSTMVSGAANVLLGKSDAEITGAMNWANLQFSTNNGATWQDLSKDVRQGIKQPLIEVGMGTFNWTAYSGMFDVNDYELRVGYQLKTIEIFKGGTLEVALASTDTTNVFATELTDYVYNPASGDALTYSGSTGSGNVRFVDSTNTGTGIKLNAANSYTGTTFISGTTTLVLNNTEALGSGTRHTTMVNATETGAVLDLNGNATSIGGLQVAGGGQVNFNNGVLNILDNLSGQDGVTATALGGGTVAGDDSLIGSGTLNTTFGNLAISGSNGNLHVTATIAASATVTLQNTAGLGDGSIANTGLLAFDNTTGTNFNAISGAGLVTATNAANVTLGGVNTSFTGTWSIADGSALKAVTAESLGAGSIAASGTLVLGGNADYALQTANVITGAGMLVKEDASTVTISHSNSYTGGSVITGGTLRLGNLAATGTGNIENNAALDIAAGGTFANNISGSGTTHVTFGSAGSEVVLSGSNATDWRITGAAQVTRQQNLGDGIVALDGGSLLLSATAWDFTNALTGDGTLTANLSPASGTFAFAQSATHATAFSGAVDMRAGYFRLDATAAGSGTGIMREGTLILGASGSTLLDSGTYYLGGLSFDGGVLKVQMHDATRPEGMLTVGDLHAPDASKIALDNWSKVSSSASAGTDFFYHDSGTLFQQLVRATGIVTEAGAQIDLVDFTGASITDASLKQIQENGGVSGTATYDYGARLVDEGPDKGIYLAYMLREISANTGTSVTLNNAGTQDTSNTLTAKLTGEGGFNMSGTGVYRIGSAASDYTGTTAVASGTVVLYSNNGFGRTAQLDIAANTGVDLGGKTQAIGALAAAAGSTLDFNTGELTITGTDAAGLDVSSTSNGALTGAGALTLQSGTLTVNGANATLTASATINTAATIIVNDAQGLGAGAITASGELVFDGASGANINAIGGEGLVTATNAANVILGGANTGFTGTWNIAGASALKSVAADSLGAGAIASSGTLVLGGAADYALQPANEITGTGALVKEDANTVTIGRANGGFSGNTFVNAGELSLANLGALGTGTVNNSASLRLDAAGVFANTITGTGLNTISAAGVTVAGTNTLFTGTWNITGSGTMTAQRNLGASGATAVNIAEGGDLALVNMGGNYTFNQQLTGEGRLLIANSGTFGFGSATGGAFTGTVILQGNRFALNTANAAPLANATLEISAGNLTTVADGAHGIGNLALNSGTMQFAIAANGTSAAGMVSTNTLAVGDTVIMVNTSSLGTDGLALLQQDEGASIQLVSSATLAQGSKAIITGSYLVDEAGNELGGESRRDIAQSGDIVASGTYNFAAAASGSGLYLAYALTHLDLLDGKTTVLDGDSATPLGADDLGAIISGAGNLKISATNSITLNAQNTYTGTTFITSGTLIAGADNALGNTSWLASDASTSLDLNGRTQTIGGGQIDGALLGSGSLGLAGHVDITSSNSAFTASVGVTGTTVLHDAQSLGSGTADIAGLLVFDNATGTNLNAISGGGLVTATNAANVTLGGANTSFTGTWDIAAASALKAVGADSLGLGAIANSGTLVLGGNTDYALQTANTISSNGTLVKEDASTVTISHSNSYTGGSVITGGTLRLENLAATGTGNIANNAALDLAATGTFANNISGSGTTRVSDVSDVTLTGSNQTDWRIDGSAQVATTANLGDGATHIDGALVIAGDNDWDYANALTGSGLLSVDLGSPASAFNFAPATGTAFSGTLRLANSAFDLSGDNTLALSRATLVVDENNSTTVGAGAQQIGNLTLQSGTIAFRLEPSGTAATGVVSTGTFALSGSTVVVVDTGTFDNTIPFLQQDERHDIELVSATAHTGATLVSGSNLVDQNGNWITDATQRDIVRDSTITASGTYDFAALASGSGLHLGYELVALDLLAGQTTVLDNEIDNAVLSGADELHARVSGSGNLQISATGAIWLNNSQNTYTGTTLVASGTLVTGNSGALGATSLLSIDSDAAADLRGTAQTIGALDNQGSLHFAGGTLTVQNGGASAGSLDGEGALLITGGTLSIAGANTGLNASAAISAGAVASLKHVSSLGTGGITADGTLELDTAAGNDGILANSLSGSGTLLKTNDGRVTIAAANPGFAGSARVASGHLALENLLALNTAAIDVDAGATLEYQSVSGTLANTVNGSGSMQITTSVLDIAHDNAIANSSLDNAIVYLSATQALGPDTASVYAGANSAILVRTDGARLGRVTLEGATLGFAHDTTAFHRATLASLAGNNAALAFNADFTGASGLKQPGEIADHLAVTGSSTGAFTVRVNPLGGLPTSDETAIPLITDANGAATYQLDSGTLEIGLVEYSLDTGARADSTLTLDPGTWYLYTSGLSQVADAIIDTASLLAMDWHYSLDALYLRMGDIRRENLPAPGSSAAGGNIWLRSRGYQLNATSPLSGRSVRQYAYGVTAGGDKAFETQTGVNLLGGFLDMGRISRDFGTNSSGATGNVSAGLYATLLKRNGWHADFVVKADRYQHDFDVSTVTGRPVRGNYATTAYGASAELGRRLERASGWWVEPAVQAAIARLGGASYRTTPDNAGIEVKVDDATSAQYRGLVRFGRRLEGSRWSPYGKFGIVKTDSDGGAIRAHNRDFEPSFDGWRVEFGLGAGYRIDAASQLYLDYEYGRAAAYERPWSFNLGYRRLW